MIDGLASPWPSPTSRIAPSTPGRRRERPARRIRGPRGASPATISRGSPNLGTSRRIRPPWTIALTSPRKAKPNIAPRSAPADPLAEVQGERPLQRGEGQDVQPPERHEPADARQSDRVDQAPPAQDPRRPARPASAGSDSGSRVSTRTQAIVENPAATRNGRRSCQLGVDRQRDEQAAQQRPEHEPDAERRADHPEAPRPVLGRGDVGHVRLRHEDVAARGPVEHPGQEHDGEVAREAEDQERDRRARLADDQDGPAPVAVAQPAEDRPGDELAHRVRGHQQADLQPG